MPKGTEVQVGFFALQSKQTFPIRLIVLAQPISPISLVCILSILSFFPRLCTLEGGISEVSGVSGVSA